VKEGAELDGSCGGGAGRARERDKTRRDSDIHTYVHTHHTLGIPDSGKNGRGHKAYTDRGRKGSNRGGESRVIPWIVSGV
jgi:hypothetical protein